MLLWLFERHERFANRGDAAERTRPRCHNGTRSARLHRAQQLTVFYVPVRRGGRRDLDACPICGHAVEPHHASRSPLGRSRAIGKEA